jgi:hypothetical protein
LVVLWELYVAQKQKLYFVTTSGVAIASVLALIPALAVSLRAETFKDPPVLRSNNVVLDILMIARPNTNSLFGLTPLPSTNSSFPDAKIGWIYDICPNPGPGITACPPSALRSEAYGGTRLALLPGDKLKVTLVNKLPPFRDGESKHALDPGFQDLAKNPTNLHTHGLIVTPREPTIALTTAALTTTALAPTPVALPAGSSCAPLPPGQRRRVYYGIPNRDPLTLYTPSAFFGLAYEIVYDNGQPVDPSKSPVDVSQYDPVNPTICLPLGLGGVPVKEIWELLNIA